MNFGTEEEKKIASAKVQVGVFQDEEKPGFFEANDALIKRLVEIDDKKAGVSD